MKCMPYITLTVNYVSSILNTFLKLKTHIAIFYSMFIMLNN